MKKKILPVLFLASCNFITEGMPLDESSSSSDEGSDGLTTTTTSTSVDPSSSSSASTEDGSSEDTGTDDDPTFGESATTTHGDSTTAEPVTDWALAFDGTSYARKLDDGGSFTWTATDFTVETWVNVLDVETAHGVIFDTTDPGFTSGWVLYFHNDWRALVFSFFDEAHMNQVVAGPALADLGTGWHHIAATKADGIVILHVDGSVATTQSVSETLSFDDEALWALGGNAVDNPSFRLVDAIVDDVRVSGVARYGSDFDPPSSYDPDDEDVILTLELDEGSGDVAMSVDGYASFELDAPTWAPGNEN